MNVLAVSGRGEPSATPGGFQARVAQGGENLFIVDVAEFRADWDANGPMVPGIKPLDAVERLKNYKGLFDVRKRKWKSYAGTAQELFGLPITTYPELEKTEKELEFLSTLYDLVLGGDLHYRRVRRHPVDRCGGEHRGDDRAGERVPGGVPASSPQALRRLGRRDAGSAKEDRDDFLVSLPLVQVRWRAPRCGRDTGAR